ncbi:efflux RND transporter periplasmic adaptor subunit [Sphingomonas cavernae]|uniref:Efflux RND transporter periplasmic adaptor subunit n=1 Tax=Sphingomonas cavernae TaxID=2320861 RepID=A0A418WNW3_9SPHN|nr:efflux RND transporter periplasmic adaptor subunit [Sphingomonas cavernae]RJF92909.1 efflux RND transporter periplasmic adaptor subunit [Sphingomonas cavernae]
MNDSVSVPQSELGDFLGAKPEAPWRKWVIRGVIGVTLLAILFLLSRCFAGDATPNYTTREVRRGDLTVTVSATGNLKPINQVDVGSEQSGKITQVFVDVNDRVVKGQRLAELDTRRLIDNVAQNRSQVASAQAGAAQQEASLALAKATLDRQEEVYRISGGKVPSKTEMDSARANYRQAVASLRSARAQVGVAQSQLSTAQTNLDIAQIVSPVTGVVLSRAIEPGQTVAASFNAPVLFTIAEDLKQMEVEVSVDEADVGQVQNGQAATFTVDAFPGRNFPAQITRVNVGSNAASSSSSSSSSTSSSSSSGTVVAYTAVLSVQNADETLRPGMTATADIVTKQLQDVLLVPNSALRFNPQQAGSGNQRGGITSQIVPGPRRFGNRATQSVSFGPGSRQTVYVVGADGKPKAVNVVIGDSDGSRTVITGGELKEGMKVITGQLAEGQQAPEADRANGNGVSRQRSRDSQQPGNATAPARPATPASNATSAAPAIAPQAAAKVSAASAAAGNSVGPTSERPRLRDMTPEQRRAFLDSLTPEQREEFRKRREERRAQAAAADGE